MSTAPQYKLNRTLIYQFPAPPSGSSWYGTDMPSVDDAGEFVLFWGGYVYDEGEYNDPFYLHIVKVDKATFTVVQDAFINTSPSFPFYTCGGLTVVGNTIYALMWGVGGPGHDGNGYYWIAVIDLDTLTVIGRSNEVTFPGYSIVSSGGNERDINLEVRGDYIIAGATGGGRPDGTFIFKYQISANVLALYGNVLQAPNALGSYEGVYKTASDGTIYRFLRHASYGDGIPNYCTLAVSSIAALPTFTDVATVPYFVGGITEQGVYDLNLDEANGILLAGALRISDYANYTLQISVVDGSIIKATAAAARLDYMPATTNFGWRGFAPVQDDSDASLFYLQDEDGTLTTEPEIAIPAVYANDSSSPAYGGYFWDMLFTGVASSIYANVLGSVDYSTGGPLPFFEYIPDQPDYPGADGIAGYTEPEDAGVGVYKALDGFTASAIEHKSDSSVDNLDVTHFLDTGVISETDLRAGKYDFATVEVRVVNYKHPERGCVKLLKGELGRVSMKNGIAQTELRGLTQKLSTNVGSTYGPVCRAELFSGADGFDDYDPGNRWKCRKDPTQFQQNRTVGSAPDALTVTPTSAPTTPTGGGGGGGSTPPQMITLSGVQVQAAFVLSTGLGSFDLVYGGTPGAFQSDGGGDRTNGDSLDHLANGNSLLFNETSALYNLFGIGHPVQWAVLSQAGSVVSHSTPDPAALENWEVMIFGEFHVPAAGNYTFNIAHDDGLSWAVVPSAIHPADLVTVVSGHTCPPLNSSAHGVGDPRNHTRTAYNGYQFAGSKLAANNWSGNWSDSWVLHFPAPGNYLFEFDYTNWEHRTQLVVNVAGQSVIPPDDIFAGGGTPSGWWDDGELTFTSGALSGQSFDVQTYDGTSFKLFAGAPLPFQPSPGDTFQIRTGCNHLIADCYFKYNNVINFQGENQMPGQLIVLTTPDLA